MKLSDLRPAEGAVKRRKRVGRGPGSGLGKTGGRGIKGQTSRSGVAIKGFEGGQMPIHRRLPKRGFNAPFPKEYAVVNLGQLQSAVDRGRLDASATVDEAALVAAGVVRRPKKDGVRILAKGAVGAALTIHAAGASKAAVEAVEKAGGSITIAVKTAKTDASAAPSA